MAVTVGNKDEKILSSCIENNSITSNHLEDSSVKTYITYIIDKYIKDNEIGGSGDSVVDPVIWKYMCEPANLYTACLNAIEEFYSVEYYAYKWNNDSLYNKSVNNDGKPIELFYKLTTSRKDTGEYVEPVSCHYIDVIDSSDDTGLSDVSESQRTVNAIVLKYKKSDFPDRDIDGDLRSVPVFTNEYVYFKISDDKVHGLFDTY